MKAINSKEAGLRYMAELDIRWNVNHTKAWEFDYKFLDTHAENIWECYKMNFLICLEDAYQVQGHLHKYETWASLCHKDAVYFTGQVYENQKEEAK